MTAPAPPRTRLGAAAPWLVLLGLVLALLALVSVLGGLPQAGDAPDARGWWAWDAGWYRRIAEDGYGAADLDLRFFPLFPLVAALAPDVLLVVVALVCGVGYLAALQPLATELLGDEALSGRAVWLAALAPGAAVLVLPYAEAPAALLAVLFFLGLHRGHAPLVAVAGLASGLVRPTGLLLALPAALWLLRERGPAPLAGVLTPVVGTLAYGLYAQQAGLAPGLLGPYDAQSSGSLRGGLVVNPLPGLLASDGGGLGTVPTLLLAALLVGLAVRAFVLLPLPLAVWTAVSLGLALTSVEAASLPRYAAVLFPLALVVAHDVRGRAWPVVLGLSGAASGVLTAAWFAGHVVP